MLAALPNVPCLLLGFPNFVCTMIPRLNTTQVWAMKEAEVAALVRQLLQADKVIHEQQLGWSWQPPDDALFTPTGAQPGGPASTSKHAGATSGSAPGTGAAEGGEEGREAGEDGEPISEEEAAARAADAELQERLRDPRYYGALSLLVDEAGFLIDTKAHNMMERLPKDEAGLVAADSIVRALGVTDGSGFDALMGALSADSTIEMRAKGMGGAARLAAEEGRGAGGDAASGGAHGPVLVHPDEAVRRLRAFVEVESAAPTRPGLAGPSRAAGAMRRAAELEQEFWLRMTHVISDKGTRVWRALEKQLEKYLALLQARASSLNDVSSLQHQNAELRTLLNQYLASRINEELILPPTQII